MYNQAPLGVVCAYLSVHTIRPTKIFLGMGGILAFWRIGGLRREVGISRVVRGIH